MSEEENQDPNRGKDGRFLPGNNANPTGENGTKGLPDHAKTCEYYLTHYTFGELKELIADTERMSKLSVFHAQIVTQLAASIANGKERGRERERLYDRLYGRPVQRNEHTGKDGKPLFASDKDALRSRLLSPVAPAGTGNPNSGDVGG